MSGQDVCFDFQNYHLYIPYAFLHGRLAWDIIPAGALHTFFNPLLDVPSYFLFTSFSSYPRVVAFLMGGYYGLFLFVLWKCIVLLLPGELRPARIMRLLAFCLAGSGLAAIGQVGRFTNEIQTACLGVCACWLLLKSACGGNRRNLYWAVFIAAFTAGLKYTAGPVAVGVCLGGGCVLVRWKSPWRSYVYAALSAAAGFLLADGYFLYTKWVELGSPLFPYFNHIFKSPYFVPESLPNGFATPYGIKEWLFLPFLRYNFPVLEYRLDIRLILGIVSFWVLAARRIFVKKAVFSMQEAFCLCLFAGTYSAWVLLFGNMRYTICLEAFSVWLFTLALRRFFTECWGAAFLLILWLLLIIYQPQPVWHRHPFIEKTMVFSEKIDVPDNSFVLLGGHLSFLVPFLNPSARYAGGVWFPPEKLPQVSAEDLERFNWLQPADYRHGFAPRVRKQVARQEGLVYVLVPFAPWIWEDSLWKDYGVKITPSAKDCRFFVVSPDVLYEGFVLCKAQKLD